MIVAKASKTEILNYHLGDNKTLERYLTIYDVLPNGHRLEKMKAYYYDEDNERLIIPRGYSIPRLQKILGDESPVTYDTSHDPAIRIAGIKRTVKCRDDLQKQGLDFLLSQGKYDNLLYNTQKFLCLKTGAGKTAITVFAICEMKRRSIIIVDSLEIAKQWHDAFLTFSNIKDKDIYMISGRPSIAKLYKNKEFEPSYKVYIALHQTFTSLFKDDPKIITKFFLKTKIGIKVYDEAHVSWNSIMNIDAVTNTARTFYLTATPGRSEVTENRLHNYCYEKVPVFGRDSISSYRYTTEEKDINERYIKVYYIRYNTHPSYNTQIEMTKRGRFNMTAYYDYQYSTGYTATIENIKTILNLCLKNKDNRRIAIILGKNDLIQKVYEDLQKVYPDKEIGRFCGLVSNKEKTLEKEKDIILSTEKSLGKAMNVENIGYLINLIPFSSQVISEQMIGRLRKNAKYSYLFDLADVGFHNCKINQQYRSKSYNNIAISIRDIDIEN